MPVMFTTTSIAANGSNSNLFSGSAFEFARQPALISIGVTQSATGLFVTINNGADVISEEFEPFILTTPPIIPDHMYFSDVANTGDRLVCRVRNSTAGALTIRAVAQVSFIGG